ncbi:hypothetical protein, partial [Streptomyces zaomyceticus]|uniref:hypothetical protein n=1 Tax=Streptomyces zaomyceticus TaxID=68286 RepID=UPI0036C79B56
HHLTPGQALQAALHTHPIPPTELDLTPAQLAVLNSRRPDTPGWKDATDRATAIAQKTLHPTPHTPTTPPNPATPATPLTTAIATAATEAVPRLTNVPRSDPLFSSTVARIAKTHWNNELGDQRDFINAVKDRVKSALPIRTSDSLAKYAAELSTEDQRAFRAEVDNIRMQKIIWANVKYNHQGCNAEGTWGTSAGGSGRTYEMSAVNAAVFAQLRAWWLSYPHHTIEPSLTSGLSLAAQRTGKELSPKLNYHLLIRTDSENRIVNRWQ